MKRALAILFDLRSRFDTLYDYVMGTCAMGVLTVETNPANNDTHAIGGVTFTYKTTATLETHSQIGATKAETATDLAAALNASTDAAINVNYYEACDEKVLIRAKTRGAAGNSFALAASTGSKVTPDASTLTGGRESFGPGAQVSDGYADSGSYQTLPIDLEVAAGAGTSDAGDSAFISPVMGNIIGANLTKLFNYLAGGIFWYSITGTNASVYPKGGVIGGIADGTTTARAAVVAHMDGSDPSAETHAEAAFGVTVANNHASSSFQYGVDLKFVPPTDLNNNMSGTAKSATYTKALFRGPNDWCILISDGVPASGASGLGDDFAGKGSICFDFTNGNQYIQAGAITAPDWKLVTRAA